MPAQRRFVLLIALILLSTLVLVPNEEVNATGTLDQKQTVINAHFGLWSSSPAVNPQLLSQTFTAGLTGFLTEVDLVIACYSPTGASCAGLGPVTVEIHSRSPTGTLLGSSSLGVSTFPKIGSFPPTAFVAFTFSSPSVVAGSVYAIVITTLNASNSAPEYSVGASAKNPYSGGMNWSFDGTRWTSYVNDDLAFETFVTPPAAPGRFLEVMQRNLLLIVSFVAVLIIIIVAALLLRRRGAPSVMTPPPT